VLGDLPRDAWNIRGAPREDVGIGSDEIDEHHFLFRVEGGTDPQHLALGGSRVEGTSLVCSAASKLPHAWQWSRGLVDHDWTCSPMVGRSSGTLPTRVQILVLAPFPGFPGFTDVMC
jgi:hypothetical protein